jgi:hypothetical protein
LLCTVLHCTADDNDAVYIIDITAGGWISEALNPLSGQRGAVVELVPMIAPLRYIVVANDGAVVTRGVELASTYIKVLPCGTTVDVCAKKVSSC